MCQLDKGCHDGVGRVVNHGLDVVDGFLVAEVKRISPFKLIRVLQQHDRQRTPYVVRIERKEERGTARPDPQCSELINQRKNNLPPKNFESNEDSLDGFDLAEFEPRRLRIIVVYNK